VGSLDIAALAALIVTGGRLAPLAPFMKVYAAIPMIREPRLTSCRLSMKKGRRSGRPGDRGDG